jgi:hypothetical protein
MTGATGPAGPAGPAGGLSGHELVADRQANLSPDNRNVQAVAFCPPGKLATGGAAWVGFTYVSGGTQFTIERTDTPIITTGTNGFYRAVAMLPDPGQGYGPLPPGTTFLEAQVYCANSA